MKVLRGTLTFVLGMVIGIILFVVAIGGTLVLLATQMTVGQIQQAVIGSDSVISSDSEIYGKTIFDTVQGALDDFQNFDKLSLKTLYEHYGIKLLNGISGIDFTDKDFYSVPIPDLINDLSIVVNSFTLYDVSKIAGVDFSSYGLPILTNNLDNNISTALNNVLGAINGDLSIRALDTNLGINLGTADNALLATLQDVTLSEFGNVLNVLRVSAILEADTDTFIPANPAARKYFVAADKYEEIPESELKGKSFPLGVETSLIGGLDSDGDGTADRMNTVETRYVKNVKTVDGEEVTTYSVDNSAYRNDFDFENNDKTFYRHIVYSPTEKTSGEDVFVFGYANRVESVDGNDYSLVEKGFVPADGLEFNSDLWAMTGDVLDSESKLGQLEENQEFDGTKYERVHAGTSTRLLQSIAHMTISELQKADNLLNGLTISDIIEITPDTARIIKSLAARNCKILELGTVANDLTLGEMIDITTFTYTANANGKYVRIEDESSFTVYDGDNADMEGLTRYKKTADGYVEDANGMFVHSVYYTLYNPADPKQENAERYNRTESEGASSALLQRFIGATLGSFSNAFDSLMLADVLQIDADIYEQIDPADINPNSTERFFYFDAELGIYRVISQDKIAEDPSRTYYHISYSGSSTSFLKKLAYVKIDDMADAMEKVVDDMMLSELVEVYTEDAVELSVNKVVPSEEHPLDENKKYFIQFGVDGNSYVDDNGTQYVYVYDSFGDYTKTNFRPVAVSNDDISIVDTYYYKYVDYSNQPHSTPSDITAALNKVKEGNAYYIDQKDNTYRQNYALCAYLVAHGYPSHVFYRIACDASDPKAITAYSVQYNGTSDYGLYAKFDSIGYLEYQEGNPIFDGKDLVTFERSATDDFKDMFFIDKSEVDYLDKALKDTGFKNDKVYFARRKCAYVYVLTTDTADALVYVDGQYVKYAAEKHADMQRFIKKFGYIGQMNEVSFKANETSANGTASDLTFFEVGFIRERSAAVLRTLAKGTVSEMTSIITGATVGDIIEAEPGTMLDKELIKNAKITELGNVFKQILTDMTIGELMTWSNATVNDEHVRAALDGITITKLFSSLVFDEVRGEIKIDIPRIYDYDTDKAPGSSAS